MRTENKTKRLQIFRRELIDISDSDDPAKENLLFFMLRKSLCYLINGKRKISLFIY